MRFIRLRKVRPQPRLEAPEGFRRLTAEARARIVNGCGPKSLPGWIVPDTLWGLSIEEPCAIHDYMYWTGAAEDDRRIADMVFLENMVRLINFAGGWRPLKALRRYRAMSYYTAVRDFGAAAFESGKNSPGVEA